MLVPHLHFGGRCEEAIQLYEKAFETKVDTILFNKDMSGDPHDTGIGHAEMHIHGQRVMLNDRFGSTNPAETAVQMVMIFSTEERLMKSYDIIKDGITIIDPLQKVFYSPLVTVFIDKFGIQWCFMVDENVDYPNCP